MRNTNQVIGSTITITHNQTVQSIFSVPLSIGSEKRWMNVAYKKAKPSVGRQFHFDIRAQRVHTQLQRTAWTSRRFVRLTANRNSRIVFSDSNELDASQWRRRRKPDIRALCGAVAAIRRSAMASSPRINIRGSCRSPTPSPRGRPSIWSSRTSRSTRGDGRWHAFAKVSGIFLRTKKLSSLCYYLRLSRPIFIFIFILFIKHLMSIKIDTNKTFFLN